MTRTFGGLAVPGGRLGRLEGSARPPGRGRRDGIALVVGGALVLAAYLALGLASTLLESESVQRVAFALPAGLACAVATKVPPRRLPWLAVVIVGASLLLRVAILGFPLGRSAAAAGANALEAVVFAWWTRVIWPGCRRMAGRRDASELFAASAICAAVGAAVATLPFSWPGSLAEVWAVRFSSHWLGIVAITPALLLAERLRRVSVLRWAEIGGLAVLLVATTELGFDLSPVVLPYVALGVMLVMVVRLQTPGAVVLPLALAPVSLVNTKLGKGPFAELTGSVFGRALAVQLYGLTAVLCAWLIAVVLAEREAASLELEQARATLEQRVNERTAQLSTATRMAQIGATVSQALAEAKLDQSVTMDDIARHLGDALDATCIIALAREDAQIFEPCVAYAADGDLQDAAWRAFANIRFDANSEGLTGQAVASGRTVRADGTADEIAAISRPELRPLLVENDIRHVAIVLMHTRGETVGTLTMLRSTDVPFDDTEARLLEDLAARAGLAIVNARLYAEVTESEERFHAAFDDGPMGMALIDLEPGRSGVIVKANEALARLTGYRKDELVGRSLSMLLPRSSGHDDVRGLDRVVGGDFRSGRAREFPLVRSDKARLWVRYSQSVVWHGNRPAYAVALLEDVSAMRRAEGELRRRALYDPLTGLANRDLLADHLELALEQLKRAPGTVAALYIDLDRFKDVNDGLGHEIGDEILRQVGTRLAHSVRAPDTAARLGGDEFLVLCPGIVEDVDATAIADRLETVLSRPYRLPGRTIDVGASIGVSMTSDPRIGAAELLRQADLAMYEAKNAGRGRWAVYDHAVGERSRRRHEVEHDLQRALDEQWLTLHYQPVIDLRSARIVGVEALLRIAHPERGLVTPDAFIDVAEESDLIVPIGDWVLHETCSQLARWRDLGDLDAAVNISGRQIAAHNVTNAVLAAAAANGVAPANLTLEMTERVLIEAADPTLEDLELLTEHGVRLAIDDFGTGYSSLTYLNRFPVDTVKIDRSFIAGLGVRDRDTAIVEAITGLARTLDLTAVAEGVETAEQVEALRALGCDRAQGYHLGRPMPAEDVTRLLEQQIGKPAVR